MKKSPSASAAITRVIAIMSAFLALSSRADAALIVFDVCTEASLCGAVEFQTMLQPGGVIDSSFGGVDVLEFGINYSSDIDVSFRSGASSPTAALGPGEIGPYGRFTQRWTGPPLENFRLIGITFEAVFATLRALLFLPARLLGAGRRLG